jgi:hypothetical protein
LNSAIEIKEILKRVEVDARIAQALMRAAESTLQCGGSVELALSNLMKAGLIFADCLNKLREITLGQKIHIPEPAGLADSTTEPFEAIFPGTFCYSEDLILFLSCSEVFHDYSTN